MESNEVATISYAISTLAFTVLFVLFTSRWKHLPNSRYLALVTAASALWGGVTAIHSLNGGSALTFVIVTEWLYKSSWVLFLLTILQQLGSQRLVELRAVRIALLALVTVLIALVIYGNHVLGSWAFAWLLGGGLLLACLLAVVVEQAYRNFSSTNTTGFKYLFIVLFAVNIFDVLLYLHAYSAAGIESTMWAARGFISAFVALPLTLVGSQSGAPADMNDAPRQSVFYTFSLVALSGAVAIWLIGNYYLTEQGGTWGNVVGIVLVTATICTFGILLASASIRARTRVFLTKTFFKYKYDYRKEWLRFIGTLSESGLEHVPTTSVRAVAPIVNSPGGIVWIREHEGNEFVPVGAWHCELPVGVSVSRDSSLIRFLRQRQWVIDLNEMKSFPERYGDLQLDSPFFARDDLWLVVPMFVGKQLFGFIALLKPRFVPSLNFEDHDLLRTVGRHVGTHMKQAESDKRLAESSQFGTYHRLSAFLMHDLNNLIAQQSLVVKNAEKFRHDPKFVDDTIDTIAYSVARMRRLMEQLSGESKKTPINTIVSIRAVLQRAVTSSEPRDPKPQLTIESEDMSVNADSERLTVVVEHLIRNAQDATASDGEVRVVAVALDDVAVISIQDNGCGMSPEFISERLFRPFDSTKGSQSMGIGAYQAREYARMLGGQLEVTSQLGSGTVFTLRLPLIGV